ncbi:hypothetical protein Bhyg_03184, partial [Pseudolycoriella hygida]
YFEQAAQRYKPTTLWSMYSMLKKTIISNHNVTISKYSRLISFLKVKMIGYESKKAKDFDSDEIKKFLLEAQDVQFMAVMDVVVFGISVGYRSDEITKVLFEHVTDSEAEIIVRMKRKCSR